jgi:hypothetical protein
LGGGGGGGVVFLLEGAAWGCFSLGEFVTEGRRLVVLRLVR